MPSRFDKFNRIQTLDPKADCQEIVYLSGAYDHPWLSQKAFEFALFRTYAVPSISRLLNATSQFSKYGQKRYDDTSLIIAIIGEKGYDSPEGQEAIAKMNALHGRFNISNDDYLYVLSVFVYEPRRWINKYGWRKISKIEEQAGYHFWSEVGRRMHIKDIPPTDAEFEAFNQRYERENFVYADTNKAVGEATIQVFLNWYPRFTHGMLRQIIYALLDEPLRAAFGFPKAPGWLRGLVHHTLKLRGRILRYMPPRRTPYHYSELPNRTYPDGYNIDMFGSKPDA